MRIGPTRLAMLAVVGLGIALVAGFVVVIVGWLPDPSPNSSPAGVVQTAQAGDLRVTMQLDDTALGPREIEVLIHDSAGRPVDVNTVRLRFSMAEMDMSTIEADAQPVSRGRFQAQGPFFTMAGRWVIEAVVAREAQAPLSVAFAFPIAAPGEASGPLNPLTPNEQTRAAGKLLYQANCAVCHGTTGQGNGPAAIGLRPAPGDFTQHMQPGKHTDGQIYLWIRDGYPQSAMPVWGQRLTEEQIWQLVTYLRTFAQPTPGSPGNLTAQPTSAPTVQPTAVPQVVEPLPPLVFARSGNIWQSDGTGSAPRQLTRLDAGLYAEYPTLAPDGSQIAFVATTQGPIGPEEWPLANPETSLSVISADGTQQRLLWKPERGRLGLTAWAPDSTAIYVEYFDILSAPDAPVADRAFQIIRVDPRSGARSVAMKDAYDLTFSRDGTQMAFLRWHPNLAVFTLNVAAVDGRNEREVIPSGAGFSDYYAPRFSPDGRQIIFASVTGPVTDPAGYPLQARESSPIDRLLGLLAPPAAEAHGAIFYLWVVNTDGTGLRRLPDVSEDTPMAVFSPDGKQIVMMGNGGIYLMNTDGSRLRKIDPVGNHGGLEWIGK